MDGERPEGGYAARRPSRPVLGRAQLCTHLYALCAQIFSIFGGVDGFALVLALTTSSGSIDLSAGGRNPGPRAAILRPISRLAGASIICSTLCDMQRTLRLT